MTTKTRPKKTKKPKWSILTYARIERRRATLGLSKTAMADALGVTNSTYHNWRRGTTVPHPNKQKVLKARMDALGPKVPGRVASRNGNGGASSRISSLMAPGTVVLGSRDTSGGAKCTTSPDHGDPPLLSLAPPIQTFRVASDVHEVRGDRCRPSSIRVSRSRARRSGWIYAVSAVRRSPTRETTEPADGGSS